MSIFVFPLLEVAQTDWMNAVSIVYIFFYITYLLLNHHYHHQRRRNVRTAMNAVMGELKSCTIVVEDQC